jgi:hypothetical protein
MFCYKPNGTEWVLEIRSGIFKEEGGYHDGREQRQEAPAARERV